jgi:hypothetical protein
MSYRDDRAALEERRAEIERRLREIDALATQAQRAGQERAALEGELAAIGPRLRRARGLPLLDDVRVASPCNVSWDLMLGDDRVRFCPSCQKNVYDLSAMHREEAERLIAEHEGAPCVRFYRRADGTVLTADCEVGVKRRRVQRVAVALAVGGGALAAAGSMLTTVQGEMSCPPRNHPETAQAPEAPTAPASAAAPTGSASAGAYAMGTAAPAVSTAPAAPKPNRIGF